MPRHLATCILVVLALLSPDLAEANADATKALQAFIDGLAAGKPDVSGVELAIPANEGDMADDGTFDAVPANLGDTGKMIATPKLKVLKAVASKSGKSAWIAGEVAGKVAVTTKTSKEPLRVSAFLVNGDKGWRVQAIHFSTGERDYKTDMCGAIDDWRVKSSVPKTAHPVVKSLFDGLIGDFLTEGGVKTGGFVKLLSDDKNALVIGSAPKEVFTGGAKIKALFKKWKVSVMGPDGDTLPARAAIAPDGELMWVAMSVIAPPELCSAYRTLFVLAKESAGWRVVHHHYSQPTNPYR